MQGSGKREEIAALIALQLLVEGAFFDSHTLRELHFNTRQVDRVLHNLVSSGVITKHARRGKYLLTDGFLETLKGEIARGVRLSIFIPIPDLGIFDVSGIEHWMEHELEVYTKELRDRWLLRTGRRVTAS
jgi:hypothetical protein